MGLNKVFKLLCNKYGHIEYNDLKWFFTRRLEEVSETEFNDLWSDFKTPMITTKYTQEYALDYGQFKHLILHRNLRQSYK